MRFRSARLFRASCCRSLKNTNLLFLKFLAEEAATRHGFRIHEIVISYRFLPIPRNIIMCKGFLQLGRKYRMDGEIKEESIDFEVKFRTSLMHFIAKNMGIIETSYLNFAPFTRERNLFPRGFGNLKGYRH